MSNRLKAIIIASAVALLLCLTLAVPALNTRKTEVEQQPTPESASEAQVEAEDKPVDNLPAEEPYTPPAANETTEVEQPAVEPKTQVETPAQPVDNSKPVWEGQPQPAPDDCESTKAFIDEWGPLIEGKNMSPAESGAAERYYWAVDYYVRECSK